MKFQKSWYKQYVAFYIVFVVIAIAILFFLQPFFNITINDNSRGEFLLQSILFIAGSGFILLTITFLFNKKVNEERKLTKETLHRYEALSNATNDAIWDYDMRSEKVFYNDRLLNIFGYPRVELADNTLWWENNIHPEDKKRVLEKMDSLLESSETSWEDEYLFRCKNGEYKIVYDRSFIVRNNDGKPIRLIGAMKDVTILRRLEKDSFDRKLKNKNTIGRSIILSDEIDRKKIKDELQEDVNQLLASIKLYITRYKSEQESDTINASLSYLDDAMRKIKKISHTLSSSTFEEFGLIDAVKDLFNIYQKDSPVELILDADSFSEGNSDKSLSLLLYRIIEYHLSKLIEKDGMNVKRISIKLSNLSKQAILKISFQSTDNNFHTIFNDYALAGIKSKLEMYEGKIIISPTEENYYSIEVLI
ncbi:MAG: PAS domain-containing protein [Bacteroidota bacterium]|nr:PAS domain-containing protein [Bacteroidota bacterium]